MLKIEITAASLDELADKATAVANRLRGGSSDAAEPSPEPEKAPATRTKAKAKAPEPTPDPEPAEEPAEAGTATEAKAEAVEEPVEHFTNFDRDVAPIVRRTIDSVGREKVVAVIEEFGAVRASLIPDDLWPELVAKLRDLA